LHNRQQANPQQQGEAEGGFLPELTDLMGNGSFEKDGSGWNTAVTGGARLGNALQSSWERLQEHADVSTTDNHEGLLVEPATAGAVGRQLQSVLTNQGGLVVLLLLLLLLLRLVNDDLDLRRLFFLLLPS
jgi:hypothetical protein